MPTASDWLFCLKCGAELTVDARFCPVCGHPVRGTAVSPGRSGPAVGVAGEMLPLASFGKRFGALIIDGLVFGAVFYGLTFVAFFVWAIASVDETDPAPGLSISNGTFIALSVASTLVMTITGWLLDTFGWSPGKAATSIRTVRLDGRRPGFVHGLVRYSMRGPSLMVFALGYLWALWDDRNQTWHDKLAGTVVVRSGPLEERIPERHPDPLVIQSRMWWLAALGTVLLTAGLVVNVWWASTLEFDLYDDSYFEPYRRDDGPRIFGPVIADVTEGSLALFDGE